MDKSRRLFNTVSFVVYKNNIDIGNKINDDKYGKLRRITENNLKIVS